MFENLTVADSKDSPISLHRAKTLVLRYIRSTPLPNYKGLYYKSTDLVSIEEAQAFIAKNPPKDGWSAVISVNFFGGHTSKREVFIDKEGSVLEPKNYESGYIYIQTK